MKKNKIICIDLDDTLSLTAQTVVDYAIKYDKEVLNKSGKLRKINDSEDYYYFARMLNWDRQTVIDFFDKYYLDYLNNIKVRKESSIFTKKLKKDGYKIFIVTSRREKNDNIVYNITKKWLIDNKIVFDKLYLNVLNKGDLIKDIEPDYFIDDSINNCKDVKNKTNNTKVFLLETKYNKGINSNIKRVKNLKELYLLIKEG